MLDMDEINREIAALENGKTTYTAIEKLALLYAVRDAQTPQERRETVQYSNAVNNTDEFITAATGVPMDDFIRIMGEHMDGVKVLYPKEYAVIIRKLNNAKG